MTSPSVTTHARLLAGLIRRIEGLERAPRLRNASIDGGHLPVYDREGNLQLTVGEQPDGTYGQIAFNATPPPRPAPPTVAAIFGGLTVAHYGVTDDGSDWPMDLSHLEIHLSAEEGFIPNEGTQVGTFRNTRGGLYAVENLTAGTTYWVRLIAVNTSGTESMPTADVSAVPKATIDAGDLSDLEDALAEAIEAKGKTFYNNLANGDDAPTPSADGGDVWFRPDLDYAMHVWDGVGGGWVPAPLGEEALADGAFTAPKIATGAVTTDKLYAEAVVTEKLATDAVTSRTVKAGEITAEHLYADTLQAGFTLTGRLQVGEGYWTPAEGIVVPQPDGTATRFPCDGVTPATISGHARLKSATIEKDFNLLGSTNQVAGTLSLANGITRPTAPPSVYSSWASIQVAELNNGTTPWQMTRSICDYGASTTNMVVCFNYLGTILRVINRTTGAFAVAPDPTTGKSWTSNFNPAGGAAYANGHYFIYGLDGARNNDWYLYKISGATFDKVAELRIGGLEVHTSAELRIGASSATGGVYLVFCDAANDVRCITWDTNLAFLSNRVLFNHGGTRNITAVYAGNSDLTGSKLHVFSREDGMAYAWNLSTWARENTWDFPAAASLPMQSLHYDTTTNKFISHDSAGRLYRYSGQKQASAVTATYTWYDGDGTVRETEPSPVTNFNLPARAYLNIETATPPDSGVTDPARVDKANRVGIYAALGAAARRRVSYLAADDGRGASVRKVTIDTLSGTGVTEPTTNTFVGGQTSPGQIVSAATDGNGVPLLQFTGAGDGRVKTLTVNDRRFYDAPFLNRHNLPSIAAGATAFSDNVEYTIYSGTAGTIPTGTRMLRVMGRGNGRATLTSTATWRLYARINSGAWQQIDAATMTNGGDQYVPMGATLLGSLNISAVEVGATLTVRLTCQAASSGGGVLPTNGSFNVEYLG